ncbi:MAG: flagellar basal body-associated protein FliL [Limisphaerales bacterium]
MAEAKKDAARPGGGAEGEAAAGAPAQASGGGIKGWLPLIVTLLAMPALAFATTKYIILPQIHSAMGATADAGAHGDGDEHAEEDAGGHGGGSSSHGSSGGDHGGKGKATATLNKMIVNVAGTMGTRYLVASVTLVGSGGDFKNRVDEHRDQLLDVATGTLSNKTISDLEKPGARNEVRAELLSVFNTVLGANAVREIYITELAIQ